MGAMPEFSDTRVAAIKTQIAQMVKNTELTLLQHFGPVAAAVTKDIKDDVIPGAADALTRELESIHAAAQQALDALKADALAALEKWANPVEAAPPVAGESTITEPIVGL